MKRPLRQAAEVKIRKRGSWTRVFAEIEERDVSHLSYVPYPMRAGRRSTVQVAGIGGVGTEPEFRRRGLARQVLARAMSEMRGERYSCAALYTATSIVAHRLYRRFGLVDVAKQVRVYKLLDPERFICHALSEMLKGSAALAARRPIIQLSVRPHEPICVRCGEGEVRPLRGKARKIDLSLSMSRQTFTALRQGCISLPYAAQARLLEWQGDAAVYGGFARALAERGKPVDED